MRARACERRANAHDSAQIVTPIKQRDDPSANPGICGIPLRCFVVDFFVSFDFGFPFGF